MTGFGETWVPLGHGLALVLDLVQVQGLRLFVFAPLSLVPDPDLHCLGLRRFLAIDSIENMKNKQSNPKKTEKSRPVVKDLLSINRVPNHLKALILEREAIGMVTYGTELHTHNGRDPLRDALEEVLDSIVYLHQAGMESGDNLERLNLEHCLNKSIELSEIIMRLRS